MWRSGGRCGAAPSRSRSFRRAARHGRRVSNLVGRHGGPGRPITSGLLLLVLPIAVAFRAAPAAARGARRITCCCGSASASPRTLLLAQDGFLIANGRDGTSRLLEYLSPRWPAWTAGAVLRLSRARTALMHTAVWLGARRARGRRAAAHRGRLGAASLRRQRLLGALLAAALLVPLLPARRRGRAGRAGAPTRPLLDAFDAVARPSASSTTRSGSCRRPTVPAHGSKSSRDARRSAAGPRPPQRALLAAGRQLPGRHRLERGAHGDSRAADRTHRRGVADVGREPRPGERWTTEFALPVDAGSSASAARRRSSEPSAHRVRAAVGRGSRRGGRAADGHRCVALRRGLVFYYDDNALPEAAGFWMRGTRTRASPSSATTAVRSALRVNSGLIANRLRMSTPGWSRIGAAAAEKPDELEIPAGRRTLITLDVSADHVFVPQEAIRHRRDSAAARHLGRGDAAMKDLRREYASRPLDDRSTDPDPIAQFRGWFAEAVAAQIDRRQRHEPGHCVGLGRAVGAHRAPEGRRRARLRVLHPLRQPEGTRPRRQSARGLLFYWSALERQVRITGAVTRVSREVSERISRRGRSTAVGRCGRRNQSARCPIGDARNELCRGEGAVRRQACRAHPTGAAITSPPSGSNSGKVGPGACTIESSTRAMRLVDGWDPPGARSACVAHTPQSDHQPPFCYQH